MSTSLPATGDGTSVSTLSVEIPNRGSSRSISSPSFFSHLVIVPSTTVSPSCGIVTGVATSRPPFSGGYRFAARAPGPQFGGGYRFAARAPGPQFGGGYRFAARAPGPQFGGGYRFAARAPGPQFGGGYHFESSCTASTIWSTWGR